MEQENQEQDSEEEEQQRQQHLEVTDTILSETSDLCQQLLDRYAKSSAPQHRHLCASAAAARSILQDESLPFTPLSYFAASIAAINDLSQTLESNAISAFSTFLSILLPLVPEHSIPPTKAVDAVLVLVELLRQPSEAISTSTVRSVVNCLGFLVGFCDLEDWGSVKLPVETLLKFAVDKRPKVRRCAQVCVEKVFKSFRSPTIIKEASKLILSLLKSYMPSAVRLSALRTVDGSTDEILSRPEHLEVLHMLNVLKLIVPYLSVKVSLKILSELQKLMSSQFSALTRHILKIIEVFFETSRVEVFIPMTENLIISLTSYVSLGEKNPMDTVLSAATLLKSGLDKLQGGEPSTLVRNLPPVFGCVAGLLTSEASTASQASNILKELINHHMDHRTFLTNENQPFEDEARGTMESIAIKSTCAVFENVVSTCDGIPNEHILAVVSLLFLKLGEISFFFMKNILLKLANSMILARREMSNTSHLQKCVGSAVIAMGPERILTLLPISLHADYFTCSNIWLVPILNNYVVGASLGFFMEYIVPLAKSFQRASRKVKQSVIGHDLQAHAHGLWGLLPAFCHHPSDTYQKFGPLAKLLITLLKKDSFMHKNIAVAIQELVNQNRSILRSKQDADESNTDAVKDSIVEFRNVPSYSKKTATRNIRALASCSLELLQALTDVFFDSPPEKRSYLKDAIGCLASISDSAVTKKILLSSLERFQLINGVGEFEKIIGHTHASIDKEQGHSITVKKDAQRCLAVVMELASSLVVGAEEDLIEIIYNFIRHTFQATDEIGQREAYYTFSRILEEHTWFCSSRFVELIDLLLGLKFPIDIASLRSRFACFHILLVHTLKTRLEEENTKVFLILNEIILTLKDSKEETRKTAYDILLMLSSSLRNSSCTNSDAPHHKLISMIMGYLSGSSPHIKSGAVSALSVLVYKDTDICLLMPDVVPSVLHLLQSKAVEVVKAVLGFLKVLVSCLQANDLQNLLSDIANGVLPWSSVSKYHFRSKVTVILEIMIRKCGSAAVELVTPEKYRGFVKSVLENRHSKTSSKESGTTDMQLELTYKGRQKRTHKDLGISPEENERPRKRKWTRSTNEPPTSTGSGSDVKWFIKTRHSNHEIRTKGQSRGTAKKEQRRDFIRDPTGGGKRKIERATVRKKDEAAVHKVAAASKLRKHKKVGRKSQKTNK